MVTLGQNLVTLGQNCPGDLRRPCSGPGACLQPPCYLGLISPPTVGVLPALRGLVGKWNWVLQHGGWVCAVHLASLAPSGFVSDGFTLHNPLFSNSLRTSSCPRRVFRTHEAVPIPLCLFLVPFPSFCIVCVLFLQDFIFLPSSRGN